VTSSSFSQTLKESSWSMISPKTNRNFQHTALVQGLLALDLHTQNGRLGADNNSRVVFLTTKLAMAAASSMSHPRNGRQRHIGDGVSTCHYEEVSRSTMDSLVEAETRGKSSKFVQCLVERKTK